mgnify:CR=1 FL=1
MTPVPPKGRAWVLLATVLGVLLTARLGVWQLDRAAQKQALQTAIDARGSMSPIDAGALATDAAQAQAQWHRSVRLHGRWLADRTVFLENRQMNGRPGFYVLTPLQLSGAQAVVLVQRGWAPRDLRERTFVPVLPAVAGEVDVVGVIAPPPSRLYEFSAEVSGPIRQNLGIEAYALETGLPLRPLTVVQAEGSPGGVGDGLLRQWPQPALGLEKHHGYAFQWFALAALMTGLYVWFQLVRPQLRRRA